MISRSFNRAIFDALAFYASDKRLRAAMLRAKTKVAQAFKAVLLNDKFAEAIESDTAGIPHTIARLELWGKR